jgi:hypothetical protein
VAKHWVSSQSCNASIDSLADTTYTRLSILQAKDAGKAVRIGRGPATVIGESRQPGYPPLLQRIVPFAREGAIRFCPMAARMGFFVAAPLSLA